MKFALGKSTNDFIVRPVTDDGLVGYDQFEQFMIGRREGATTSFTPGLDVRDMMCVICERGWEPTSESMNDQTGWDLTNSIVHASCLVRHVGLVERREFWDALVAAKVRFRGLKSIPNQYWPPAYPQRAKPWYTAELIEHPVMFKLGWRKRVAEVAIVAQGGVPLAWYAEADKVFDKEDVTKEFSDRHVLLHAWSLEKMREYVRRLVELGGYAKRVTTNEKEQP